MRKQKEWGGGRIDAFDLRFKIRRGRRLIGSYSYIKRQVANNALSRRLGIIKQQQLETIQSSCGMLQRRLANFGIHFQICKELKGKTICSIRSIIMGNM